MSDFDLRDFTPYLLVEAAEAASLGFQPAYKARYGMLRTEWRVLFQIGRYGPSTAKVVSDRARIHKTKVSRAVAALSAKGLIARAERDEDRRSETLSLTPRGAQVFEDLRQEARDYDARLMDRFSAHERQLLKRCLFELAGLER